MLRIGRNSSLGLRSSLAIRNTPQYFLGSRFLLSTISNLSTNFVSPVDRRIAINQIFKYISGETSFKARCKEKGIDSRNWAVFLNNQRRALIKDSDSFFQTEEEKNFFDRVINTVAFEKDVDSLRRSTGDEVFERLAGRAEQELHHLILANRALSSTDNLKRPHLWFPLARMMKRKIIYHGGPTNSGKTYHAIERLKSIDTSKGGGLYCGPLRLLALEVYEKLNKAGVLTNLRTGQETRMVPGAYHTASTVEMVSLTHQYDVAVIDEIQMIGDGKRGSAWTRALLGIRANEIHLCGGLEAVDLVRSLCQTTGDEFILNKYERLSPVEVESESLRGDYSKVRPGDCIVAFSVQELFLIRREVESKTKYKCAVINGKLPSETKSNQAKLFNENDTGYDILIATDAIGMGLNLNIRRIIFHSTLKRHFGHANETFTSGDGRIISVPYHVDPILVKQIAGRAGRKSSDYNIGKVTTWQDFDLAYVRAVVGWDIPQIPSAGIAPDVTQVLVFYNHIKNILAANASNMPVTDTTKPAIIDGAAITLDHEVGGIVTNAEVLKEKLAVEDSDELIDEILTESDSPSNEIMSVTDISTNLPLPTSDGVSTKDDEVNDLKDMEKTDEIGTTLESSILSTDSVDNISLTLLVERFLEATAMDQRYFLCNQDSFFMISNFLQPIPMAIDDRFTFASAPTNIHSNMTMQNFYHYAAMFALNRPVLVNVSLKRMVPKTLDEFTDLCDKHNTIDLYLWLSSHFPKAFLDYSNALRMKLLAVSLIEEYLSSEWTLSSANKRESLAVNHFTRNMIRKAEGGVHASIVDSINRATNAKKSFEAIKQDAFILLEDSNGESRKITVPGVKETPPVEQERKEEPSNPMVQAALDAQLLLAKRYLDLKGKLVGKDGSEDDIDLLLPPYALDLRNKTKEYLLQMPKESYYVPPSCIYTTIGADAPGATGTSTKHDDQKGMKKKKYIKKIRPSNN